MEECPVWLEIHWGQLEFKAVKACIKNGVVKAKAGNRGIKGRVVERAATCLVLSRVHQKPQDGLLDLKHSAGEPWGGTRRPDDNEHTRKGQANQITSEKHQLRPLLCIFIGFSAPQKW
eukprot:scaffold102349_cov17-Prasinocladus_malaysianus.AAC.1